MAKFAFILAAVALVASGASTKKAVTFRQTCVDKIGTSHAEGASWNEGVNGCLSLKCTNGATLGIDNCKCTYPDQTTGNSGDVWYSVPDCRTCSCTHGQVACDALLNCVLASVSSMPVASASASVVVTASAMSCPGPDGIVLKLGDKYIDGCQTCDCTTAGLACSGMTDCPGVTAPATTAPGSCFMGNLAFIQSQVKDAYWPNGYVFVENCNTCTCSQGSVTCVYGCNNPTGTALPTDTVVTVTIEPTVTEEEDDASLDCDVGVGIVVNGDPYVSECGSDCICVDGEMQCQDCPGSESTTPEPTSAGSCPTKEGTVIGHSGTYKLDECTDCTCMSGEFVCTAVCKRDCKDDKGVVTLHGKTTTSTCLDCKCNDATLTCENKCANQVCGVPGTKITLKRNTSKSIDKCYWCKCSSTALLTCRDKCPTNTSCMCDGRVLKSGKSLAKSKCETCKCNNGSLTCEDTC